MRILIAVATLTETIVVILVNNSNNNKERDTTTLKLVDLLTLPIPQSDTVEIIIVMVLVFNLLQRIVTQQQLIITVVDTLDTLGVLDLILVRIAQEARLTLVILDTSKET